MHRLGHQGINLVLFAPVLFALAVAGYPLAGALGALVMFTTASLPDIDHSLPLIDHRGITHTVWAVVVAGVAAAGLAWFAASAFEGILDALALSRQIVAVYVGGVVAFSMAGHLLGDVLTPMGIMPWYPVSARSYTLSLWPAKSWLANRLLFAGGVGATAAVVGMLSAL